MLLSSLGQDHDVWYRTSGKMPLQVMEDYSLIVDADALSAASDDWEAVDAYVGSGGWFVKESLCAIPANQMTFFGLAYSGAFI